MCSFGGPTKSQKSPFLPPFLCFSTCWPPHAFSRRRVLAPDSLARVCPHCPLSPYPILPRSLAPLPWATRRPVCDALGTETGFPPRGPAGDSQLGLQLGSPYQAANGSASLRAGAPLRPCKPSDHAGPRVRPGRPALGMALVFLTSHPCLDLGSVPCLLPVSPVSPVNLRRCPSGPVKS